MNTEINMSVFEKFPRMESDRLVFRRFKKRDAPDLFAIRSDPEVMRYMDVLPHNDELESLKMIKKIKKGYEKKESINWAIQEKDNPEMIGYFGFWRLMKKDCRGEIGIALKKEHWRKGIMTETFKVMLDFAFNKFQLHSIEANVNEENTPSINLIEKFGFRKEAIFRENYFFNGIFLDSVIYSLLESDYQG